MKYRELNAMQSNTIKVTNWKGKRNKHRDGGRDRDHISFLAVLVDNLHVS
jgi:hypothetical protein